MVRDLRRKSLRELGWTVRRDNIALAPDEDPDDPKGSWSLAAAARSAGLPSDLQELLLWEPTS
jgi:hypothetical protein